MTKEPSPQGKMVLRMMARPADMNINGDIFGGWVLSQMDIAAGVVAGELAQGPVATVALDAMKFFRPVKIGDIISVYVETGRIGRSSIALRTEVWVQRRHASTFEMVTEAQFTFVAIDDDGRPRPVPQPSDAGSPDNG